jgi:hypothetical protein
VHVSKRWKFIFIRQPKSSSTAVIAAIKLQLCGLSNPNDRCEVDDFSEPEEVTPEMWRDYFVFTVVRNPWTRMLSAHTMFSKRFLRKCVPLQYGDQLPDTALSCFPDACHIRRATNRNSRGPAAHLCVNFFAMRRQYP